MIPSRRSAAFGFVVLAVAALAALPLSRTIGSEAPERVSFINDVAPILKENCLACHDSRKRSGKLDISTYALLRAGGSGGDPVNPGHPAESALIERLKADGPKRMPPPPRDNPADAATALPENKVAIIERWIAEGAVLDPEIAAETDLLRELRKRWRPPAPPEKYPRPPVITALTFSPDGQRLVAGAHHELTIWSPNDGRLLGRLRTRSERTFAIEFLTPTLIAAAGGRPGQDGDVRVYDLSATPANVGGVAQWDGVNDPAVLQTHLMDSDDCQLCLAVNADRSRLATGGCDRQVRIWNLAGGPSPAKLQQTFEQHSDWVLGAAFAPDGRELVTASRDKSARVWNIARRETVAVYSDHQGPVFGVAVRPDGKAALSASADRLVRVWTLENEGKLVKSIAGHEGEILKIVRIPNASQFATASADRTVRIWGDDGTAIRSLAGFAGPVFSLAVSPDGARLAAGSAHGEIRVWTLADGKPVTHWIAAPGYAGPK